jgi:hypothetical protein
MMDFTAVDVTVEGTAAFLAAAAAEAAAASLPFVASVCRAATAVVAAALAGFMYLKKAQNRIQ